MPPVADADFKAASLEQWSQSAEAWDRHADTVETGPEQEGVRWVLEATRPAPGAKVLELACGPGALGIAAAGLVAPEGRVIASDFAEPMVEAARRRAAEKGVTNMEFRVIDAEDIDLPDESFDVVLCRFGYMLMGDPGRALAETRRVLRPGGRVGFAVWKEAERNPWASLPMGALMEHFGAPPPEPGAPGMFSLSDPDRVHRLLSDAGLTDASIGEVEGTRRFDSLDAWLRRMQELAKPLGDALTNLPEEQRDAIESRIRERAERFVGEGGEIELPAAVLVAVARRP